MSDDKRRFERIQFDAMVELTLTDTQNTLRGVLRDISLKGALVALPMDSPALPVHAHAIMVVQPEQGEVRIEAEVEVAHQHAISALYGLNILKMDVDSASFLRRLVEVNLANADLLQRELSNLIDAMEAENSD